MIVIIMEFVRKEFAIALMDTLAMIVHFLLVQMGVQEEELVNKELATVMKGSKELTVRRSSALMNALEMENAKMESANALQCLKV